MLDANYLDAIKQSEGYTSEARWDYAQNTNGYGTRARFAGEVIDKAEADKRFADEIKKAADFVEKFAPGLDEGSKAALTSLTYNAGTAWTQSGLGEAVASGDLQKAQSIFLQYNKAGGAVLDGLVQRRLQEVAWFGQGTPGGQNDLLAALQTSAPATGIATPAASNSAGPRIANLGPGPASAAPLFPMARFPMASTDRDYASPPATFGSAGIATTAPGAFAGLGGDQALLSLLSYLSKTDLLKQTDGDEARKSDPKPDPQTRSA
jgi:lysozyme